MSTRVTTDAERALGHLEHLVDRLRSRGWLVEVAAPGDRWPTALVSNGELPGLNESVIAAPDHSGGDWFYYFGWGERISPCAEPDRALATLARVLAVHTDL
ncbi:hypothetical protein [Actinomadura oligospora]|uniref:hypothetical protein n=1 Tax=Actinomadura oligospora TaxID=111804 RepID=UPI0012F8DF81|nr:hypothetical protein [Actinomadura oligospora]